MLESLTKTVSNLEKLKYNCEQILSSKEYSLQKEVKKYNLDDYMNKFAIVYNYQVPYTTQGGSKQKYIRTSNKHTDKAGITRTVYMKNDKCYIKIKKDNKFIYKRVSC